MKRTMKITQNNKYTVPDITADAAPDRKSARRRAAKAVVCFMISATIAFAACGLLYKYDNKYTGSDARCKRRDISGRKQIECRQRHMAHIRMGIFSGSIG